MPHGVSSFFPIRVTAGKEKFSREITGKFFVDLISFFLPSDVIVAFSTLHGVIYIHWKLFGKHRVVHQIAEPGFEREG
jgi:hypothetical protein